jgi:hypothetical protein
VRNQRKDLLFIIMGIDIDPCATLAANGRCTGDFLPAVGTKRLRRLLLVGLVKMI